MAESAAAPELGSMHLMDTGILKCPYHYDSTLRREAPVYRDPDTGIYVVSTYELVRIAHRKKDVFSNEFVLVLGSQADIDPEVREVMRSTYDLGKGTLLTIDDPEHAEYRSSVKDFFLADNLQRYRPWITDLATRLADGLVGREQFNFIEEFSRPLPLNVIMHVLGMPPEMFDEAFQWTLDNVTSLSQVSDKEHLLAAHRGIAREYDWFAGAVAERKENPRDDLLTVVAQAQHRGRDLTVEEQLSFCTQFLVAGNETTTATLAEGIRQLSLFPEQAEMIRADRSLIPNLVEETLRLASPTSNMWRVTLSDFELGGVTIPKGSMVLLKYFSSNHDEAMFEEPLRFDVTRPNVRRHIAFGFGPHVCIGQHLSRLEMEIAWQVLFDRVEDFGLAVPAEELQYMPNILLRGLEEIPVRFRWKA